MTDDTSTIGQLQIASCIAHITLHDCYLNFWRCAIDKQ